MLEHSDFNENERDLRGVPSLSLAYLGDGVYEVLVREYLVACVGCNPHEIHKKALEYVAAPAQAAEIARCADGVIVGSAVVSIVEKYGTDAAAHVAEYVREMKRAVADA